MGAARNGLLKVPRWLPSAVAAALFAAALWVLRGELGQSTWRDLRAAWGAVPAGRVPLAVAMTVLGYAALTSYDRLAFAYVRRSVSRGRLVLASFVAYAFSNTVGFSLLAGASIRQRFYSRWGVDAPDLARIVAFDTVTFWLGLFAVGGVSLLVAPASELAAAGPIAPLRVAGVVLLGVVVTYLVSCAFRREPFSIARVSILPPSPRLAAAQLAVSVLDWTFAAATLAVLLPPGRVSFGALFVAFGLAQILGVVSHVPGGLGIFESAMVVLLAGKITAPELLPSLLMFRAVYYWTPLAGALVVLLLDEIRLRRGGFGRLGVIFGAVSDQLVPRLLAIFTFAAGGVLLFSGASPAAPGRLAVLERFFPLTLVEASHFAGSVVGVGLLLLSHGVWRRLDLAWWVTAGCLGAGIGASLLKGADWEEAILLGFVLVTLLRSRRWFDRRAAFFATRFSWDWVLAVLAVLGSSVWLGFFAFKHHEISSEAFWQFEMHAGHSRFLRATVGGALVLLVFGFRRLLSPAPAPVPEPTDEDLRRADGPIAAQRSTMPYLVYLRDKALLFAERDEGFVMYAVQGRTWAALGDPVGPPHVVRPLVEAFFDLADDFDGEPVFYEISKEHLHVYADFGMALAKIGEEARVPLDTFSLEGTARKTLRATLNRVEREDGVFRILTAEEAAASIDALREVSDAWLREKNTAEKGFSLGAFDAAYLSRFPVAVIERHGTIEAFANVWPGPGGEELSVDLMRAVPSAPKGSIDALFVQTMLWGREHGYRTFQLGMAPLSGIEASTVAPFWNRLGAWLFHHGEAFYNFQGLRSYKEKFDPVWEPRYLAYPAGATLPRLLADVAALVAGGYRKALFR